MQLTCRSCSHDFSIDEKNLDTEKVECPRCRWLTPVTRDRFSHGYFGQFGRAAVLRRRLGRKWPRSGL